MQAQRQRQVNTEPKISLSVFLLVSGRNTRNIKYRIEVQTYQRSVSPCSFYVMLCQISQVSAGNSSNFISFSFIFLCFFELRAAIAAPSLALAKRLKLITSYLILTQPCAKIAKRQQKSRLNNYRFFLQKLCPNYFRFSLVLDLYLTQIQLC